MSLRSVYLNRKNTFYNLKQSLPVGRGLISIEKDTQKTEIKSVFAGGDAANGPATVIEAIAAGRRAAISIDIHLGGDGTFEFGNRNAEFKGIAQRAKRIAFEWCDLMIYFFYPMLYALSPILWG